MRKRHAAVLLASLMALLLTRVNIDPLGGAERVVQDRVSRVLPEVPRDPGLAVIVIDEQSLRDLGERWPVSRDTWARFIEQLSRFEPSVIALDVIYDQPSATPDVDLAEQALDLMDATGLSMTRKGEALANFLDNEAMRRDRDQRLSQALASAGRVVLAMVVHSVDMPMLAIRTPRPFEPLRREVEGALGLEGSRVSFSIPSIGTSALGVGSVNILTDPDGVVRRYPLVARVGDGVYGSLALRALIAADPDRGEALIDEALRLDGGAPLLRLPLRDEAPRILFSDVLNAPPEAPGLEAALKGRVVFVGVTALGVQDSHQVSSGERIQGIDLHLIAASNLLGGELTRSRGGVWWLGVAWSALVLLIMAIGAHRPRATLGAMLLGLGLAGVHLTVVYLAAWLGHALFVVMPALLGLGLMAGAENMCRFQIAQQQRGEALKREHTALALRDHERRFRRILDHVAEAVFTTDEEGGIETINPATRAMFDYREGGFPEHLDALLPEFAPAGEGTLAVRLGVDLEGVEGGHRFEAQGLRGDGSALALEVTLSSARIQERPSVLFVAHDITERKALERMKEEFIGMTTHELRTPLTSIQGSLALLRSGVLVKLEARPAKLLDIAHNNCARLLRLIDDLLDLQKMEAAQMVFEFTPQDLRGVIEETSQANQGFADEHGVSIQLSLPSKPVNARLDRDRLIQAVTNLISNAIKYSPRGGTIDVGLALVPTGLQITVGDHGPGIPHEYRAQLFEKFTQGSRSKSKTRGTGLGLAITREICQAHGGDVHFTTTLGVGSVFFIDLPPDGAPEEALDGGA